MIQKDTHEYIQERLHKVRGSGLHEAEAILLLAQKVGYVESALVSLNESLDYIQQILTAMIAHTSEMPEPY